MREDHILRSSNCEEKENDVKRSEKSKTKIAKKTENK